MFKSYPKASFDFKLKIFSAEISCKKNALLLDIKEIYIKLFYIKT
jgi:hypothetical protein